MSRLSDKTIDELNDKVDFTKAFSAVDSLYEARSLLNNEAITDLKRLVTKLEAITEGAVDEEGDELFDMAEELQSDIMDAQEHLEKIYDVLESIFECYPDPDDDCDDEDD